MDEATRAALRDEQPRIPQDSASVCRGRAKSRMMLQLPEKIFVATQPGSMHLSFDRLTGIVRQQFGGDPRGEALHVVAFRLDRRASGLRYALAATDARVRAAHRPRSE